MPGFKISVWSGKLLQIVYEKCLEHLFDGTQVPLFLKVTDHK